MRLTLLVLFVPATAFAACPDGSEQMISCTFKDGATTVTTCLAEEMALYSYGPTGRTPDLALIRNVRAVDMYPWQGIGRWIAEAITFENAGHSYTLRYAIDRLSEDFTIEGDLLVARGDETLATLSCDAGSVTTSGYPLPLYDAKVNAGQVWSNEDFEWKD